MCEVAATRIVGGGRASGSRDIVDAAVVVLAARLDADVVTGDADDIAALAAAARVRVRIFDVVKR